MFGLMERNGVEWKWLKFHCLDFKNLDGVEWDWEWMDQIPSH